MAFEDSLNGIRSARAAGLKTIITINGYTRNDDFAGAAIVLDNMGTPENPLKVLAGNNRTHTCLNLEMVRKLHSNSL